MFLNDLFILYDIPIDYLFTLTIFASPLHFFLLGIRNKNLMFFAFPAAASLFPHPMAQTGCQAGEKPEFFEKKWDQPPFYLPFPGQPRPGPSGRRYIWKCSPSQETQ